MRTGVDHGTAFEFAASAGDCCHLLVEKLTSIEGVGALMIGAQRSFQSAQVYGLLVLIGLFGFLVNDVFAAIEAILLRRWPPKNQSAIL